MTVPTVRLGVVAAAFHSDLRIAVGPARLAGFHAVQLEAQSPALDLTKLSESARREIRHLLGSHDLALVGLRAEVGGKGLSPTADIDYVLARLEAVLAAAASLGAALVCLDIGPLPEPPKPPKKAPNIPPGRIGVIIIPPLARPAPAVMREDYVPPQLDPTVAAVVDGALAELARRADRYGVTLALRSDLASFSALHRALKAAACPWFGVDLDPVGLLRDELTGDEVVSNLAGQIRHVRGRDAAVGSDRRIKPALLGRGNVDWSQLLAMLDSAGYRGFLSIDPLELMDRPTAAATAAEALRKLMQ